MSQSITTQFNAYNYQTFGKSVVTGKEPVFTPDSATVYLVKHLRVVNRSANQAEISVFWYSGDEDFEYTVYLNSAIGQGETIDMLEGRPVVVRGDLGDELRVQAQANDELDVTATVMLLGRDSGL